MGIADPRANTTKTRLALRAFPEPDACECIAQTSLDQKNRYHPPHHRKKRITESALKNVTAIGGIWAVSQL